jgi:NADPH2:quinone reductase
MKAIRVSETGGPEQLRYEEIARPECGRADVRIRIEAAGVNFIDVYHRTGLYKLDLPFTPGMEGAGIIDAIGDEVIGFKPGDRVAYAMTRGSYADYAVVPEPMVVAVPQGISTQQAAATMLQGMTAHYLTRSTWPLKPGDTALVHAGAGGTGQIIVQLAKSAGARVLATVGSREKAEIARAAGADETILYVERDFAVETKRLTNGRGVDVVYDSVGASTWDQSLSSLRPRGMMVSFGNASGAVAPFAPAVLATKGSLYLTRPSLAQYIATREELIWRADELFTSMLKGSLRIAIDKTYPLAHAPDAHRYLEGRNTKGKLLLVNV